MNSQTVATVEVPSQDDALGAMFDMPVVVPPQTFPLLPGRNLLVVESSGESCPLAFCHSCGRRIEKIGHAGVVWSYTKAKRSGYRILCKDGGTGTPGLQGCLSQLQYRREPWMELRAFLGYTLWNLGLRSSGAFADLYDDAALRVSF